MTITYLSIDQRRTVEQIAREKGAACPFCKSINLSSDSVARPLLGGPIEVDMECKECWANPAQILSLTSEEVETRLELDHNRNIRDFPEANGTGRAPIA